MFSFLQSGWFWLLVGSLLLILAGCVLLPKKAPVDSPTSPHPIISFTVTPFSSETLQLAYLEPNLAYLFTPTPTRIQRQISSPPDEDYYAERPNCFPSPNGGYSCLGRVWNISNEESGSIILSFILTNEQSQSETKQNISIEQRLIPSQSFAPYRLIIPSTSYQEFEANVERAIPNENYHKLSIVDSRGQMSSAGRYRLTTTILNDVGERVENFRLFASLVDDEQQIIGYRIYEVEESLNAGERRVIEMEIIPQAIPESVHHELHVEGRTADE